MNRELMYKVADKIEKDKALYDQGNWFNAALRYDIEQIEKVLTPEQLAELQSEEGLILDESQYHWCRTTACIAGHTMFLSGKAGYLIRDTYSPSQRVVVVATEDIYVDEPTMHWNARTIPKGHHVADFAAPIARRELDMPAWQAKRLFDGDWKPREGMTVPEALRALADGAKLSEVTSRDRFAHLDWYTMLYMERFATDHTLQEQDEKFQNLMLIPSLDQWSTVTAHLPASDVPPAALRWNSPYDDANPEEDDYEDDYEEDDDADD